MTARCSAIYLFCCAVVACIISPTHLAGQPASRVTLSLDGQWEVDESVSPDAVPTVFTHKGPVPGLTHSATPAFSGVDEYQTRQLLSDMVEFGDLTQADYEKTAGTRGVSRQPRNYFWYRRTFTAPAARAVALLKINKAQFGTVVYLNGVRIGEHDPCYTAAWFDVTKALRWEAENELVVRIGAHPGVLPAKTAPVTDFEKYHWTPGIYDSVSLIAANDPIIATVQVAPKLETSSILVQTVLRNYSSRPVATSLIQTVTEWKSAVEVSTATEPGILIPAHGEKTVLETVRVPNAHLWSPEDPFLYKVLTTTGGDSLTTRFGMREFHFDTATQRAYLNGKVYFLRGSNITLHRFFEDPEVGMLPWDEAWLHRLLVDIPKHLHWNAFRFCIGPVPDRWLEIADENGLLIQNEYPVWVGAPVWPGYDKSLTYVTQEMMAEYSEWMRDNWNHASVVIWDASNESILPEFTRTIIPAVRRLDLSNRPWENSYNAPAGPDDPIEDHQYLFAELSGKTLSAEPGHHYFQMSDLEEMAGPAPGPQSKTGHAMILNEYGWLWLHRDGSPTFVTQHLYPRLLGDRNNSANRLALQAYLLGGETEFWRAYRRYAAVLHFVYLTSDHPKAFTSDHWLDLKKLELQPDFERAMENAFNPLGIYLNFWQPELAVGRQRDYTISMVNDEYRSRSGTLRLEFVDGTGKSAAAESIPFTLPALGAQSYVITLLAPRQPGSYSLQAVAVPADDNSHPIVSHRNVALKDETK